jgi:hypothetical protein
VGFRTASAVTVVRNIQLKVDVPEEAHTILEKTFKQFRYAAQ